MVCLPFENIFIASAKVFLLRCADTSGRKASYTSAIDLSSLNFRSQAQLPIRKRLQGTMTVLSELQTRLLNCF